MTQENKEKLEHIASCIADAGLSPYEQLYGYLHTGNTIYVTRQGNARDMIQLIDKKDIKTFLENYTR